jgi:hypothetical protein
MVVFLNTFQPVANLVQANLILMVKKSMYAIKYQILGFALILSRF